MVPEEMVPEQIDSYSQTTVPTAESAVYKPSSPLDLIVSPLVGAAPSAPTRSVRGGPDVRQYLPAGDRENAQILSVTDETLAEAQARAGQVAQTGTPTPATTTGTGTWTARRPSATQR